MLDHYTAEIHFCRYKLSSDKNSCDRLIAVCLFPFYNDACEFCTDKYHDSSAIISIIFEKLIIRLHLNTSSHQPILFWAVLATCVRMPWFNYMPVMASRLDLLDTVYFSLCPGGRHYIRCTSKVVGFLLMQ